MFNLGFIQRGCFLFSEENICESCLATILPSGCTFSVYISKSVKVVLCLKADFNIFCDVNVPDMAKPFSVVVFHCRHMFHKECLPSSGAVSHLLFVR